MVKECMIPDQIVDKILQMLKALEVNNLGTKEETCTKNGFQSPNILEFVGGSKIKSDIEKILDNDENIFHMHLIHYHGGGFQEPHNHARTEDSSFILYLNDSDGNTVFENLGEIQPKKGKLVYFSSDLVHYGKPSFQDKKICVGALKKVV